MDHYSWLATAAMPVSAITGPIVGKMSDLYGRRGFYLGGLVVFMAGSVLDPSALSQLPPQVASGVQQGLADSLHTVFLWGLVPYALALVATLFIKECRCATRSTRRTRRAASCSTPWHSRRPTTSSKH